EQANANDTAVTLNAAILAIGKDDLDDEEEEPVTTKTKKRSRNTLSLGGGIDSQNFMSQLLDMPEIKDKAPTNTPTDPRDDDKKEEPAHESEDKHKKDNDSTQDKKDIATNANGDKEDKHVTADSLDSGTGNELETETEAEIEPTSPGETGSSKSESTDVDTNGTDEERAQLIESFLELKEPQINWKMVEFFAKTSSDVRFYYFFFFFA
ncbi:hypothetical protein RFI_22313, partial [Reticulomyxa filosa]